MRILIVDDHMIIRRGLKQILAEAPGIAGIEEAPDGPGAMRWLREQAFDVVLLDIALGSRDGLDVLAGIRNEFPRLGVIMLSVYPEAQFAVRAIKSGANAYLNKGCEPDDLLAAIAKVGTGGIYVTPAIAELLAQNVRKDASNAPHELLSNREFQVLKLLAAGQSVGAISQQLALSPNTISTYRARIFDKLNVRTLVDLIGYVNRHQLV